MKQLVRLLVLVVVVLGGYTTYTVYSEDTVKIANWNLQIYGQSKASNEQLVDFYADKIDDYDIVFVQEIRDASETAFPKLCAELVNYTCITSSRAGRSSSKEQYGIIYKNGINLTYFKDYNPDSLDRWERPPIETVFQINDKTFTIYNIHTKPDAVEEELMHLETIIKKDRDIIILGDLNADCSYYNNDKETEFDNLYWLIQDNADTTVSQTDCAYDRIILSNGFYQDKVDYGIDKKGITDDISDHYLVWVEFKL